MKFDEISGENSELCHTEVGSPQSNSQILNSQQSRLGPNWRRGRGLERVPTRGKPASCIVGPGSSRARDHTDADIVGAAYLTRERCSIIAESPSGSGSRTCLDAERSRLETKCRCRRPWIHAGADPRGGGGSTPDTII